MKNKLVFIGSALGLVLGLCSAWYYGIPKAAQPPAFQPASNPFAKGIYANGILESFQAHGENINLYPEIAGSVARILVAEGDSVKRGAPLLEIDDSVQKASTEQLQSQAQAAQATLDELRAQPRKEALEVAKAQVDNAAASLNAAQDQQSKLEHSYTIAPQSVSAQNLDAARDATGVALTALDVARKQYELVKAGAWIYDIRSQEKLVQALGQAHASSQALLAKYTIRAPDDGVVLSIRTAPGSYVSAQGAFDSYTGAMGPAITMSGSQGSLQVRCFIDEILVHKLPDSTAIKAQMAIRGTDVRIPLDFVRVQPYVSPKIELTSERTERVDVRVLPLIFKFEQPRNLKLYPGQIVDVYIEVG